jgi:antitoxin ParD1/3/4
MANRTTLNISLTPELEEFVASQVGSGRYQSASEVVRQGLRLLQDQEITREAQLEGLRHQIQIGLDQADRRELLDGEEVFEELQQRGPSRPW